MRFADVRGHRRNIDGLQRSAADGRVAGAYLFVGPTGIGKRAVADAFTRRLLCTAPTDDDACAACGHCTRVAAGTHPDVHILARDPERRDIRTDQARELCRWLGLRALMAERKVALIDGAECLNEHGQNALLKTLEEPPGGAVVILIATSAALLLPTVRSRCRRLRFDPLPHGVVTEFLVARGVPAEAAVVLAAQAGGSPGRALELTDEQRPRMRALVLDVAAGVAARSAAELSKAAQDLARGPVDAALAILVSWYRDVLRARLGEGEAGLQNPDHAAAIGAAAARLTPDTALRQLTAVCDTLDAVARNANRPLALETLFLMLRAVERAAAVESAWTNRAP
jgi:DNA polymerase-3 subunit delta'